MDSQIKILSITYPYGCIYFRHCAQPEGSTEEQKSSLFQIQKIKQHIEFVLSLNIGPVYTYVICVYSIYTYTHIILQKYSNMT